MERKFSFNIFIFFFLFFIFFSKNVFAECERGQKQKCGVCGIQVCVCDEGGGNCKWGECIETSMPPTEKAEGIWTGYKCESSACGGRILKKGCVVRYTRNCQCVEGERWECSEWQRVNLICENATTVEVCQPWQVCAVKDAILKCDDETCWMETKKDIIDIIFGKSVTCNKNDFRACQPTEEFQPIPLSCKCWGKCLEPVIYPRYYDGGEKFKELPWKVKNCKGRFRRKLWMKLECELLNKEGIKLPVKLGWDMPKPWRDYWASSIDNPLEEAVWSLKISLADSEGRIFKEIFLTHDELLNESTFKNSQDQEKTKKERLEEFKNECLQGKYNKNFYEFLKTWDSGLSESKLEEICTKKDSQRLDQILYFIYFVEGDDPVGKPGGWAGIFTYSISQDKKRGGPCTLASDSEYQWKVKLCCGKKDSQNCGPPDSVRNEKMSKLNLDIEKWKFKTHPGPEPIGVLETKIDNWWVGKKKRCFLFFWCWTEEVDEFKATAVRWIDTDWNGPKVVKFNDNDFVEFEWCKVAQKKPEEKLYEAIRSFYKGKVLIYKPLTIKDLYEKEKNLSTIEKIKENYGEEVELRIEERKGATPPECENPKLSCPCENPILKKCLCDKAYSASPECKRMFIKDTKICLPSLVADSQKPRIRWKTTELREVFIEILRQYDVQDVSIPPDVEDEFRWQLEKRIKENCGALITQTSQDLKLARKTEQIVVKENPYFPITIENEVIKNPGGSQPKIFSGGPWKWDFQILPFPFYTDIIWQPAVGIATTTGIGIGTTTVSERIPTFDFLYGQEWGFRFEKSLIMEWEILEEGGRLVETPPIKTFHMIPPTEKPTTTVDNVTTTGFNRIQIFGFDYVKRTLGAKVEICDKNCDEKGEKRLPIPLEYLILRKTKEEKEGKFIVHQVWPCIDIKGEKLDKIFEIKIIPCFDEWGENCKENLGMRKILKSAGEPPTGLNPPPPSPKKIPTVLDWEPTVGAPSYFYEISTPKGNIKEVVSESKTFLKSYGDGWYTWKVKSCADNCKKEDFLQCGKFSKEVSFYGCELNPPEKFFPPFDAQFYPEEPITFSWENVICQGKPVPFYQFKLEYFLPTNCENIKKELREKCKEIQETEECKKLAETKDVVSTTLTTNSFSTSLKCLGGYLWSVRGCLDESCKESGDWMSSKIEIVLEKTQRKRGAIGFGTCKNIITCTRCRFSDIPKIIGNILSCLLWTVSPLAMVFLLVYTGIGIYFSFGDPKVIERAKKIWKEVLIGWLIMLFSWTIVRFLIEKLIS